MGIEAGDVHVQSARSGSLRSAKTANLEGRTTDASDRRSDQRLVWNEVERQSAAHSVNSETEALDDVQDAVEDRIGEQLDRFSPVPGQVGVVCTVGDRVVGLDLFDKPSTLDKYLRGLISGHSLDASMEARDSASIVAVERFLRQVAAAGRDTGNGVGLGEEILLRSEVAGIGLAYQDRLVHLAAYPTPV